MKILLRVLGQITGRKRSRPKYSKYSGDIYFVDLLEVLSLNLKPNVQRNVGNILILRNISLLDDITKA